MALLGVCAENKSTGTLATRAAVVAQHVRSSHASGMAAVTLFGVSLVAAALPQSAARVLHTQR